MHWTPLLAVTGATALVAWSAIAAPTNRVVSLDECLKLALEHNLDLQISKLAPQVARLTLSGAYSAYDPRFEASAEHNSRSSPGGVDAQGRPYPSTETEGNTFALGLRGLGPNGLGYSLGGSASDTHYPNAPLLDRSSGFFGLELSQPLLKGFVVDDAKFNIAVLRKESRISDLQLQQQVMRTVRDVQLAYYSLVAAVEAVKVQEQALALAEQQLAQNKKRVEVGVMAPLDEKEAESLVASSRASLLQTQNALKVRQNALKSLLTGKYPEWVDIDLQPTEKMLTTPMTFSRQDSWMKALTKRPELLQARVDLERRDIVIRRDRAQLLPQFEIRGSYGLGGAGKEFSGALDRVTTANDPSYSFGAVFSMPLENRQARTTYRTSKLQREQAVLAMKKQEQDVMVAVDNAISQAQSSLEEVRARGQAVQHTLAAYEAEQKKLDNGKSTSFQVLSYQNRLTEARYQELFARSAYVQAITDLAFVEGTILEQNGIVFGQKR
jgi:outer membrane protein TolC